MEEAINELLLRIERLERKRHIFSAEWISTESVDANLSKIDVGAADEIFGTSILRFIPKLASVSPSAGDTVICLRDPVIIIGVLRGDINLASE